ncbi:hypothetical protein [Streptomyces palmae]|uniref:hypothetical protein n=1 Tax=Streptomyces palmae TaxID=1701085 RepID=UPI001AE0830F|nr:hypothetical protein [Streptomyces palmae]
MNRIAFSLGALAAAAALVAAPEAVATTGRIAGGGPESADVAAPYGVINHSCGLNVSAHQSYLSPPVTLRKVKIGSAVVELRSGATASTTLEWARIRQARRGDPVWLDWSDDGRRNWHVCGPYKVRSGDDALTRANNSMSGRAMRACGRHGGVTKCTSWSGG